MIRYKVREQTRYIILHDTHTDDTVDDIMAWLKRTGRKMGLLEIGYHYVIDRDGTAHECRALPLVGTAQPGRDLDSVYIALVGGLEYRDSTTTVPCDNFTPEQRVAVFDLVRTLRRHYGPVPFMGHYEFTKRVKCYCPALDMIDLRADYDQYIKSGGVSE